MAGILRRDGAQWHAPAGWQRITTIDAHTAGEPLRVITSGIPEPVGSTMLAKRDWMRQNQDHLRRALMLEPRGHADMYGCLPTDPVTPDGDFGVLFLHNEGYSTMCGHGIIAVTKVVLDCGLVANQDVLRIDTPAGRVTAVANAESGSVESVSFKNVPSFLLHSKRTVVVPQLGDVCCDIAFGGAFYAYVDGAALGLTPDAPRPLIDVGMRIKHAVMDQVPIVHPEGDADLNFLYGTIFVWPGQDGVHSRNVCIFADGEVDRSPTGTGVSGRAAIHFARGEVQLGQTMTIESIIRSRFDVRAVETTTVGSLAAIVPEVTGSAFITGRHEFLIDPSDPLADGVFLR